MPQIYPIRAMPGCLLGEKWVPLKRKTIKRRSYYMRITQDQPLKDYNTLGLDVRATFFIAVESEEQAEESQELPLMGPGMGLRTH